MWDSTRFMSPEEYQLGAVIDEVSNLVALGALAHAFLGDDQNKTRDAWTGSGEYYEVTARALQPERTQRWASVADLATAWRQAGL